MRENIASLCSLENNDCVTKFNYIACVMMMCDYDEYAQPFATIGGGTFS
jgi:hypothetical protein